MVIPLDGNVNTVTSVRSRCSEFLFQPSLFEENWRSCAQSMLVLIVRCVCTWK